MYLNRLLTSAVILTSLALAAPVGADQHDRGAQGRDGRYSRENRGGEQRGRSYERGRSDEGRRYESRAVPRREWSAPYRQQYSRPYVRPYGRSYGHPYVVRPGFPSYRPGFSIGIFLGRPFPYRYAPRYGYPVVVNPGVPYGGVTFNIAPGEAAVYVDGQYVGYAGDLDGSRQPLTLAAGSHQVELQAEGYEPMAFEISVVPGQVTPYQGTMQPAY